MKLLTIRLYRREPSTMLVPPDFVDSILLSDSSVVDWIHEYCHDFFGSDYYYQVSADSRLILAKSLTNDLQILFKMRKSYRRMN